MRLTRRSIRARRSLACRPYWARSFRARSVTGCLLVYLGWKGVEGGRGRRKRTLQLEVVHQGLFLGCGDALAFGSGGGGEVGGFAFGGHCDCAGV